MFRVYFVFLVREDLVEFQKNNKSLTDIIEMIGYFYVLIYSDPFDCATT